MVRRESTGVIWGAIGVIAATLVGAGRPAGTMPAPWQHSETRALLLTAALLLGR